MFMGHFMEHHTHTGPIGNIYIYMGIWASYAQLLLHGVAGLIYMAIYGRKWLYMLIYTLKYVFGVFGHVFWVLETQFAMILCAGTVLETHLLEK